MKKIFSKKEITKVEVESFKELTDEQLNKIVGGDRRDPRGIIGIGKKLFG
ncbi:ComC/BlpC family peptide pheromone/bacteriocin [Streptococcus constellatus]|uniref:Competence stimulating peptide n=1 Tax=Streptococcus milleri TaxID=33040 RepID=O33670_9STRE|nr:MULTISPECIES: ComC/BlpC family leader-containing pheromone/bacteriocin [Streptococcus]KXU00867.1 hypothetical protein SCODD09_01938 [Streptococcus constellatus]PNM84039.1 ComC/BlpC family peptide pheromone/bacteriocin [Streptococcus sp. FDAARGOS_146]RID96772.1 ComC/BlpC family peptide pheromone/bacteriocin [Streptococcus constellatus]CAA04352.1 competence stimulating peptide [Streptococcus milleri]SUN81164.1 competence stimulating peptide precursor [Streptococcus milleri]